jgi:hypothetical protein
MWTIIFLILAMAIGWKIGRAWGSAPGLSDKPAPSIHDERCPVCMNRIPLDGLPYGTVRCEDCGSSWLAHDFTRQGSLVCSECNEKMIQRVQDPYDENLFSVEFRCGRKVAAYMLGEKREMSPCTKTKKKKEEGPERSQETVPSESDAKEREQTFFADDYGDFPED